MTSVLLATTVALLAGVVVLAGMLLRVRARVHGLESRVAASAVRSTTGPGPAVATPSPDATPAEYLITRVGVAEREMDAGVDAGTPTRVEAAVFTDQLARESAVQLAALAHGLRRALSAETRHRIRFHMRQEVKRARKQRRVEMRMAHREWTARQRTAAALDDRADHPAGHSADHPADHAA